MLYLEVNWTNPAAREPVQLFSELKGNRTETRKVEVFADGSMGFADKSKTCRSTRLSKMPVSSLAAINAYPELDGKQIERDDFERLWRQANEAAPD